MAQKMPKQTNIQWIRQRNRESLEKMRQDRSVTAADYARALERAQAIERDLLGNVVGGGTEEVETKVSEILHHAKAFWDANNRADEHSAKRQIRHALLGEFGRGQAVQNNHWSDRESLHSQAQARLALAKAKHIEAQTEAMKAARTPEAETYYDVSKGQFVDASGNEIDAHERTKARNNSIRTSQLVVQAIADARNAEKGDVIDVRTLCLVARLATLLQPLIVAEEEAMEHMRALQQALDKAEKLGLSQ